MRIFHSLRYRDYALFWSSDLLASLGHFVQEVALYWIAYEITGSAMALGILGLCGAAPRLLLGALGGVLVDRYNRKRLLILIQFCSAIPVLIFLALYTFGALEFWHLLALEVLFGSIRAVNPSASQSILAELVPREDLMNAVSLYTIGFNFARIVGPSAGGILILWIGIGGCYEVFLASLILSGMGLLLIRLNDQRAANPEQNFAREFKEGFQYVWASPVILSSIVAAYTFSILIVPYQRFMPVFAKEVLEVGPEGLGLLMAAPGVGAIASLTFLASVGERWNRAWLLWITTTVTPIFLILFCLSPVFWLSVLLLGIVGAGQVSFRTISRVIIQIEAPRDLLGRVMSVFNMDQGMRSLGSVVMGVFATIFGASLGLALTAGVSLIVTTTLFYRLLGKKA
ncbi:MAG: MFS transporter [Deltaproteobacteria bacterium]|nr:MFS transporter [Deltaproteobacteria bacterium]